MKATDDLPLSEMLRLNSLGQVVGGFAHEIAQPLNAIMIASQVVQMKVDRSELPGEEKDYISDKLDMVCDQVTRVTQILEELRQVSVPMEEEIGAPNLKVLVDKAHDLMAQQLANRGVTLTWDVQGEVPSLAWNSQTVETALIQSFSFARDIIQTMERWHRTNKRAYEKSLAITLFQDSEGAPKIRFQWNLGDFDSHEVPLTQQQRTGLALTDAVISSLGGKVETTRETLQITFCPATT